MCAQNLKRRGIKTIDMILSLWFLFSVQIMIAYIRQEKKDDEIYLIIALSAQIF